jgi:hypothetical protein
LTPRYAKTGIPSTDDLPDFPIFARQLENAYVVDTVAEVD